jgi:hypothetical protein
METQENNWNPDEESLASDGPVSKNEGDGGADLNDTDAIPGSADETDDFELDLNDDENTNVDQDDIDALDGMDYDDEDL